MLNRVLNDNNSGELQKLFDDPVKWAYCNIQIRDKKDGRLLPWKAREYQAEELRCKRPKKVLRWGRRSGKTESQIIYMLWKCIRIPSFRVIIVTPFENQIRAIFTRLGELIGESPLIQMDVANMTKNPYVLKFKNNSSISGFTAGTKSGQGGASIRGQGGDLIYMDEADYLQDTEIEAIVAIAFERPDIEIILTSTPTGKRGFFYKACNDPKLGYTEFYTPSTKIPTWNRQMESEFRAMFSEVGYQHEVLAEFGEEVTGVFNKTKVDQAITIEPYYYMPLTVEQLEYIKENKIEPVQLMYDLSNPAPANCYIKRCIGIDWDKNKGGCQLAA